MFKDVVLDGVSVSVHRFIVAGFVWGAFRFPYLSSTHTRIYYNHTFKEIPSLSSWCRSVQNKF